MRISLVGCALFCGKEGLGEGKVTFLSYYCLSLEQLVTVSYYSFIF